MPSFFEAGLAGGLAQAILDNAGEQSFESFATKVAEQSGVQF